MIVENKKKVGRPRKTKEEKIPTFTDKYEDELKRILFKEELDRINNKIVEDIEESPYYDKLEDTSEKKQRNGIWDISIDDEILYFDPTLSHELTGYRPINETQGLDFDPSLFMKAGEIYMRTGKYTEFKKGTKPYSDFWKEELKKSTEGLTVGKYRITGDHYFFLNFYRMKILDPTKKASYGREYGFPNFYNKQYEFFHYIELCEYLKKDAIALKSRGVKSCPLL